MALLEVSGVRARYGAIEALKGVSLTVGEGEVVTLIGSNGAGKSTTLRAICGLTPPVAGTITFDGENFVAVAMRRRTTRDHGQNDPAPHHEANTSSREHALRSARSSTTYDCACRRARCAIRARDYRAGSETAAPT